ncbi:methylamine dehydrogenase (amicyanin) large subunit [Chthonobacter rhizosphaerae]|uniref:methylamine dehydrogenase (amicyanin) large subunit n=1 Tax=Chthonobacter rhizosphaerae TaxID=2735553 RepID=UPI0015EE7818|nr:methylamine dehydrogenase (amicyanin) large subunit [Chthonobacter rhizosphaerae]
MTHAYRPGKASLRSGIALSAVLLALTAPTGALAQDTQTPTAQTQTPAETAPAPLAAGETHGTRAAAEAAAHLAAGGEDEPVVLQAPAPDARRVYVNDPAHFAAITQQYIVDGNTARVVGMVDAGFLPNPVVASDGSFFGHVSSVWSRIARGERTDYVEVFDPVTHEPTADIELPNTPRFLVGTYPWMSALTPNNKTLLFYQFSPTPAVGVVDLAGKRFDRMIEVPDCYHIFPSSDQTFYMHCRDGSLLKVTRGEGGEPQTQNTEVFHREDEYLINHPAYSPKNGRLVWPTYTGKIFQADLGGENATFREPIEAFTEEEKQAGWAPGGWQQVAYHRDSNRIFLLADQRPQWTHKTPSRFVLVIDAETGQRIARYDLGRNIDSIAVSQDAEPQLYALSTVERTLFIHDAATGEETSSVDQLGHGPQVITTADM